VAARPVSFPTDSIAPAPSSSRALRAALATRLALASSRIARRTTSGTCAEAGDGPPVGAAVTALDTSSLRSVRIAAAQAPRWLRSAVFAGVDLPDLPYSMNRLSDRRGGLGSYTRRIPDAEVAVAGHGRDWLVMLPSLVRVSSPGAPEIHATDWRH